MGALGRAEPRPDLRTRFLSEASADHRGGATNTGVRWWMRYCLGGRCISPLQHVERDAPHAAKLDAEIVFMDFALWLYFEQPSGRSISVASISKYISQVHAYLEREHGCLASGGMDRVRLRALLKGLRRAYGQPATVFGRRTWRGLWMSLSAADRQTSSCGARYSQSGWLDEGGGT